MGAPSRGSKKWLAEREAWRARRPWPVVTLNVDPGDDAGVTILAPGIGSLGPRVIEIGTVDTYSRAVERWVDRAIAIARGAGLPLILVTESWGKGGPLGIDQWLGLGAMRGTWRREVMIRAGDASDVLTKSRSMLSIEMTTWRSFMIEETGGRDANGGFVRFEPEDWKRAATRTFVKLYPGVDIPDANAAESALLGSYAMRSDELGSMLPETFLRKRGFLEKPENPKTVRKREAREKRKAKAEAKALTLVKGPRSRTRKVDVIPFG